MKFNINLYACFIKRCCELTDELGKVAKCENGYHRYFNDWAEKDVVNMVRHFRNSPSVIMWSIGNEVPTQWTPDGYKVASMLQDICHREDPGRVVTCGMDQFDAVVNNGFGARLDIPGPTTQALPDSPCSAAMATDGHAVSALSSPIPSLPS